MKQTPFEALANEIAIDVIGCPHLLIVREVRNAAIRFCEATKLLRKRLDAIDVVAGQADYIRWAPQDSTETLAPPDQWVVASDRVVVDMRRASCDGQPLNATSRDELDLHWRALLHGVVLGSSRYVDAGFFFEDVPTGNADKSWEFASAARPTLFFQPDPNTVRLVPTPSRAIAQGLVLHVAVKPDRCAASIEDWFFQDHFETLAAGARARLLAIPGKPWSEPKLAVYYAQAFERASRKAHGEALRDHARNDQVVGHTRAYV